MNFMKILGSSMITLSIFSFSLNHEALANSGNNKYRFITYYPNKTNPQNITYSLENINNHPRVNKAISEAIKEWNRSRYIEIRKKIDSNKAKVNNHIFFRFKDSKYYKDLRVADERNNGTITIYKDIERLSQKHIKKIMMHEIGHALGFSENPYAGKNNIMNPLVNQNAYITKIQFDGLKYRYGTKKGQQLFHPIHGLYNDHTKGSLYNWDNNLTHWHNLKN